MRQETINSLTKAVAEKLGVGLDRMKVLNISKDNGIKLTGITITGASVGSVCYLEQFADAIETRRITVEDAAVEIARNMSAIPPRIVEQADRLRNMDKDTFLEGVQIRLMNREQNEDAENTYPCFAFLDMIGVFQYVIDSGTSIRVTHELARHFDLSLEELKNAGLRNAERDKKVLPVESAINSIILGNIGESNEDSLLWLFTNKEGYFGAATILLLEPFQKLADKMRADLYILPSSRHEVLALPKLGTDMQELLELVRFVNQTRVSREDFLSNSLYQYTRRTGTIDFAE